MKFQGGDDPVLTPDDKSKYTLAFAADGGLSARPPGSLHDQIVKQLPFIRPYVTKGGHLFLSLMADGGIYEFEPFSQ